MHNDESHSVNECYASTTITIILLTLDNHYFKLQPSVLKGSDYDTSWNDPCHSFTLVEGVKFLREHLNSIGGELIARVGDPTIVTPKIVREIGVSETCCNDLGFEC